MEKKTTPSVFETLNAINCNEHTEKKNGLTYLSWAFAWSEVKKAYPDAFYTIYEDANGCIYHTDGKTCWVKTGVTIKEQEYIEYLPIMDFKNNSIPLERVTSFDANKAIQRSLTKACARHGLGLYIYAGEDLPEADKVASQVPQPQATASTQTPPPPATSKPLLSKNLPKGMTTTQYLDVAKQIANGKSRKELADIYSKHVELHSYIPFVEAMKSACAKFPK